LTALLLWLPAACEGIGNRGEEEAAMAEKSFEELFTTASTSRGSEYLQARDEILALHAERREAVIDDLNKPAADSSDWRQQLTAQMVRGWITNQSEFELCTSYVKGDLPGPRPLPGFTAAHRAEAIASLGEGVTPRVLEMVWKAPEYKDSKESSALFGTLATLKDRRATMPMFELIEEAPSVDIQTSAIRVLVAVGEPKALELLLKFANDPKADEALRIYSIRSLGGFEEPEVPENLTRILLDKQRSTEERAAAADALETKLDPTTRPAVLKALRESWDENTVMTLVSLLGGLGINEDITALKRVATFSPDVAEAVEDAVNSIRARQ